jgi:hypothetical protein
VLVCLAVVNPSVSAMLLRATVRSELSSMELYSCPSFYKGKILRVLLQHDLM